MERNAKIGIAGVVLAGLVVGVYYQHKKDETMGTPASKGELPELHVSEDIDKIDIHNGSKGEVILEKHDDKWVITTPVTAPANQQNCKSLVDNIKELKINDRAVSAADDEAKKTYELTPDKGVHVVATKGGETKLDATFGKSGGLGDAMMIAGKPDIYLVKGYSSFMYGREVKDWRDREIFKIDDANVATLEIDGKNGKFVFTKNDKDFTGTFKGKPIDRLDPEKPKTALNSIKSLQAEDFGDGKSPGETGLDAPEETVTVRMKDGSMSMLKIGKPADKAHYAQRNNDPTIYTIGSYPYEWMTGDVAKFQLAADAGAPPSDGGAKPAAGGKGDAGKK
jgi:Domain of unknown function (DUF4340)